jgi:hypothetical protein
MVVGTNIGTNNIFLKNLHWILFIWTIQVFLLRFPNCIYHKGWHQWSFDVSFKLFLKGFVGERKFISQRLQKWHLENNNHVHLRMFYELTSTLYGMHLPLFLGHSPCWKCFYSGWHVTQECRDNKLWLFFWVHHNAFTLKDRANKHSFVIIYLLLKHLTWINNVKSVPYGQVPFQC